MALALIAAVNGILHRGPGGPPTRTPGGSPTRTPGAPTRPTRPTTTTALIWTTCVAATWRRVPGVATSITTIVVVVVVVTRRVVVGIAVGSESSNADLHGIHPASLKCATHANVDAVIRVCRVTATVQPRHQGCTLRGATFLHNHQFVPFGASSDIVLRGTREEGESKHTTTTALASPLFCLAYLFGFVVLHVIASHSNQYIFVGLECLHVDKGNHRNPDGRVGWGEKLHTTVRKPAKRPVMARIVA